MSQCTVTSPSRPLRDLSMQRFGQLVALERAPTVKRKGRWKCVCDCGAEKIVRHDRLTSGRTKSCGHASPNQTGGMAPEAVMLSLYRQAKKEAARRGLIFSLALEQFAELILSACYYCGVEHSRKVKHVRGIPVNGIDRLDSRFGYLLDNCVPCCTECNLRKLDSSETDFYRWIGRVYRYIMAKPMPPAPGPQPVHTITDQEAKSIFEETITDDP